MNKIHAFLHGPSENNALIYLPELALVSSLSRLDNMKLALGLAHSLHKVFALIYIHLTI